jgi:hypothetical protein
MLFACSLKQVRYIKEKEKHISVSWIDALRAFVVTGSVFWTAASCRSEK